MRLVEDLTNARLVVLTDCPAFASLDQPDLLAAHLHPHLAAQPHLSAPTDPARPDLPKRRIRSLHALRVPAPDSGR